MRLSQASIRNFIDLYHKKYGVVLSMEDALDKAIRLVKLIELIESRDLSVKDKQQNV